MIFNNRSTSLKNILTIRFVIVAVLPVLVIGLISLQSLSVSLKEEITARNFLLAKSLRSELEQFLTEPLLQLEQIKDVVESKKIVKDKNIDKYLSSIIKYHKFFDMIKILDSNGIVVHLAPYDENISGLDMSNQTYYQESIKAKTSYWSQTFISPQAEQPTLTVTLPMKRGLVVGHLYLSDLSKTINKIKLGENGYAAIADNDGTIIAHQNLKFVAERLNVKNLPPVSHGMKGIEGTFKYNFRGLDKMGSVAIVPHTRWIVVVSQPIDEALAPVYTIRNIIIGGSIAAIILAVLISLISLQKALKPLLQLTEESKRIAGGDYSYTPQETSYTEIFNLGHSYQVMIDAVKTREDELTEHRDHLEEMVKKRTSELEESKIAADDANQAKSQFLANMSHEIRTPMNAILGFTEIMLNKIENPQLSQYLEPIYSSGKALLNLINDILDLSKVEAGKFMLKYTTVSMDKFFNEIKTLFVLKTEEKNINFIAEFQPDLPNVLIVDEIRLRQIMINLIGNAIKFTDSGSIKLSVGYSYPEQADNSRLDLILKVEDTGIGIPPDKIKSIFDAFSQIKQQQNLNFEGTGLGLTITKNLVEMMKGSINVESESGKGSVFTVIINDIEVVPEHVSQDQADQQIDLNSLYFERSTILIADDIEYNREILKGFFEDFEFDILEAENGKEALETARKQSPHLICLDMKMPVMDGYEASKILKNDAELHKIPVIAITASALKKDEETILKLCDSYLRKPINRYDLILEIMNYLPHSIKEKVIDSEVDEANQEYTLETLKNHTELLKILKKEVEYSKKLSEQMNINAIEEFTESMNELASKFNCSALTNWSKTLNIATGTFNITAIKQILKKFSEIEDF